jgi:hypothetical protein
VSELSDAGVGKVVYHNDGTATLYLTEALWILVTPEQCERWIVLLRGVAQTAMILQAARRAQVYAVQHDDCDASGRRVRPIGWRAP